MALQLGHRKSVDLDFFSSQAFDELGLSAILEDQYQATINGITQNSILSSIDGIKVDIVSHQYPLLQEINKVDSLKIASLSDIAAMKLNAIKNRGGKKDFFDLYFLLKKFEMSHLMQLFREKYSDHNDFLVLKSLLYFEDAELEPDPFMLIQSNWNDVKKELVKSVNDYINRN